MDTEFSQWTKVVFWAVVLIVGFFLFRDYNSAPVEWRAGRAADKEVVRTRNRDSSFYTSSYAIVVDSCGTRGRVLVNRWSYTDWSVGQACEVASRHGQYMNYDFLDIRRP